MKIAVLFGSSSNEHEVSVVSAASIIKNLNKEKYQITPIYMDKENNFYLWHTKLEEVKPLKVGILPTDIELISNPFTYLQSFDLIFMMIHGKNGEDGILSSIFDFLNIKYIGNKPAASMITMDKIYTKDILEKNNIKTSKYLYFTKYNNTYLYQDLTLSFPEICNIINETLNYPLFVKPANSGSSIGITKVSASSELQEAISTALKIDNRILIEEGIKGREVECGILEKDGEILASCIGEITYQDSFYSFDAKYNDASSITVIPANIDVNLAKKIQEQAIKVFKVLNCHGYSRCDFFIQEDNTILLNEINTIPGFTEISMYPKLFEASGIKYSDLLDILINEKLNQ